jgi:hypothetical protein
MVPVAELDVTVAVRVSVLPNVDCVEGETVKAVVVGVPALTNTLGVERALVPTEFVVSIDT